MLLFGVLFAGFLASATAKDKPTTTPTPDDQKCLQSAFEYYLRNMSVNADLGEYVQNSLQSRFFYDLIWTKPLNSEQWKRFCKDHNRGYQAFDACPNTTSKIAWKVPSGLANYVCQKRLDDFVTNAPCLEKAVPKANAACAKKCAEFEAGSNTYVHPSNFSGDLLPYLAIDCQYLKCTADCHRPVIEEECPKVSHLQLDTLYVMEGVMKEMHEPPEIRDQLQQLEKQGVDTEKLHTFPASCRLLSDPLAPAGGLVAPTGKGKSAHKATDNSTASSQDDQICLLSAAELYLRNMSTNVDLADYVQNSQQSRFFYETVWTKPITAEQWRKFCKDQIRGFKSFDACPNSTTKTQWLLPSGLVNYICQRRVEDFAANAPCLQKAIPEANDACAKKCSEFEAGSKTYIHPENVTGDMLPYLDADCKYLKCTADCRRPIFEKDCPKVSHLQLDTLYAMEQGSKEMHEPPEIREQLKQLEKQGLSKQFAVFPDSCRLLSDPLSSQGQ